MYIENGELEYSTSCKRLKKSAKINVIIKDNWDNNFQPKIMEWCVKVTVTPEDINNIVFNKGMPKGLRILKWAGGHTPPMKILGFKL